MPFDLQEIFANLVEKEKIKGHHSPEGRAIRTLSRGLNGWSAGNLSPRDVIALCDQAVEDWLKTRQRLSSWSAKTLPALLVAAVNHDLMLLRKMFNWAIRRGYIERTPFKIGTEPAITLDHEIPRDRRFQNR